MTTVTATEQTPSASSRRVLGVFAPHQLVMISLLGLAFVSLFFRWFARQHRFSMAAPEDWAHVYFIPLISLYILWRQRDALAGACARARVFWPALGPLLVGVFSYWFFIAGYPNHMFQGASLVLTLFAVVLLTAGPAVMRVAFLPIAFLLFGITISEKVMIQMTFPMQTIAAAGADVLLKMVGLVAGFTSDRMGNLITVISGRGVEHTLDVAQACSGMRMVVAFMALGAAVALLGARLWWQRVSIFLLTIPVAILLNVVRVAVMGLLTLVDADLATGEAHTLIGTLLLIPGLLVFMGVVWVLRRIVREETAT